MFHVVKDVGQVPLRERCLIKKLLHLKGQKGCESFSL